LFVSVLIEDITISKIKNRVLSITHQQDVDGLFCGAILKNAFPDTLVHLTNYGYSNMVQASKTIENSVSKSKKRGIIIISDLSVDDIKDVEPIEAAAWKAKESGWYFLWIDHHFWNENIRKKVESFATLILSKEEEKKCASELICQTLHIKRTACQRMAKLAHDIDFGLNEITNPPPLPEIIRYYLTLPNAHKKLHAIVKKASKGVFWDDELQEVYESKYLPLKESAMKNAMDSLVIQNLQKYKVAIVESPQVLPKSIIAQRIFELHKDADLAILFAPDGKLSIRRKPDSDIKCDLIAQRLHGGGHSYAAGGIIKPLVDEGVNPKVGTEDVIEELQKALK
jgi:oligoribonuclease NrnB/cAMP/cGMP phosphodiesterase (DHH superfamily)